MFKFLLARATCMAISSREINSLHVRRVQKVLASPPSLLIAEELNIIYNEHASLASTLAKQAAPGEYTSQAAQRAAGIALLTIYVILSMIPSRPASGPTAAAREHGLGARGSPSWPSWLGAALVCQYLLPV